MRKNVGKEQKKTALRAAGRIPGGAESRAFLEAHGLRTNSDDPRSVGAFEELVGAYPGFRWFIKDGRIIGFDGYPQIGGENPSLADLVENARRMQRGEPPLLQIDTFRPSMQRQLKPLLDLGEPGIEFARMLEGLPWSMPPVEMVEAYARWLKRALDGELTTLVSPVCPDYTVEGGRYTFSGLGNGIGLVAGRVLSGLPSFVNFARRYKIDLTIRVVIGDFEAVDTTCERVGLTRQGFIGRLRESQHAFAQAFVTRCPRVKLETPLVTEMANGSWASAYAACVTAVERDEMTGPIKLKPGDMDRIMAASRSLYQRWYGPDVDALVVLKRQAPEYGAMGMVVEEHNHNPLIFGGDRAVMAAFYQMNATKLRPVVYLRAQAY
ncbi:MAG: hypothetical protein HYV32_06500 [Candidatus Kerfeldbacteria bacterium]|nr:hypothetical protein [Candidatus Kerfeldbacteria bacterium]